MTKILKFISEVNRLKETPRTGWVLTEVKNPETIAEHTFRLVVASWLLARRKNLSIKRAIFIALFHDLCEVYAGDVTPFFYYIELPKDKKEREKKLMSWVRLSKKEKERRGKKKFEKEKESLLRLIDFLGADFKKDIFSYWIDYERRITREGKFVKQLDRVETLIQAIEYFGKEEKKGGSSWWEGTEEIIDDPLLLEFLKVIQKKFYGGVVGEYKNDKELENILDFLLRIGRLKKMQRLYWKVHGIKDPETVAGHIFTVTLLGWILGREKKKLNMEKILKMAICHEISAVFTGDTIPYIKRVPKDKKKRYDILKKWPRLPKEEKRIRFLRDYREEKKSVSKLTRGLDKALRKEIIQLWDEYRRASTPEALFLGQVNTLAVLLQGLEYQKKYKNYFTDPLWEWAFEKSDDPITLSFMEEMKKKFYESP
jgi:putative hydrolase of HD superfamily